MTGHRVLVSCIHLQRHLDRYAERFRERGIEVESPPVVQRLTDDELRPIIGRFDGMVAGDDEIGGGTLSAGTRLRIIVKWGIGVDSIDLEAARRLGIPVVNTPGVFGDEVADVVVGYIILLARQLHRLDQSVRQHGWGKIQGMSLRGRRLGIIGVGSIGGAVARRARSLGMEICGYDLASIDSELCRETDLRPVGLPELLATSDFISLNCPLSDQTRHLLDSAAFAAMRPGCYVINTGRGPLIDEAALAEALEEGTVAGAALDVFEDEPLPAESRLRSFDQCIFGTHNASNTLEAVLRTNERALDALFRGLETGRTAAG